MVVVGLLLLSACGVDRKSSEYPGINPEIWPEMTSPVPTDAEAEAAVEEMLGSLSLEEKVGQVIQAELRWVTPDDVRRYRLGSVLNGGGCNPPGSLDPAPPEDWLAMADAFYDASTDTSNGGHAIPAIWGTDAVHGHNNVMGATIFPHNIGLGATRNPELMRRIGEVTAIEVAVTGLDWTFAPTLAVVRDDHWGRTYEGYSEDPEVVRALAGEVVRGLQGTVGTEDFLGTAHVVATAKHFLGDGGTERGKNEGDTRCSEEQLRDIHGAGYMSALDAGVQTVMASFSSWHGRKMHGNHDLLTTVLKQRMGFDGFVIGDWDGHSQLRGCSSRSCPEAFNAGVDMFMAPKKWKSLYRNTLKQVKEGRIAAERLDDAVRRILRVKWRAGLFIAGRPSSRPLAGRFELLGAPEHRALARQAVRESLVLLKNHDQLLPLDPGLKVVVAGDGADNIGKQCGGWSVTWQGTGTSNQSFPGATSIWEGIRQAVESTGGSATLSVDGSFSSRPDVAVVVFGEEPYAEGSGDRGHLEYHKLSPDDLVLLQRFETAGIPVVSIFLSGRPMAVEPELEASDAFVAAWLPGSEGGGVADLLFRAADGSVACDFTGKLAYSWPRQADDGPVNRDDPQADPLFPFGYGLTYQEDRSEQAEPASADPATEK
jgi:beta-glucosidase